MSGHRHLEQMSELLAGASCQARRQHCGFRVVGVIASLFSFSGPGQLRREGKHVAAWPAAGCRHEDRRNSDVGPAGTAESLIGTQDDEDHQRRRHDAETAGRDQRRRPVSRSAVCTKQ